MSKKLITVCVAMMVGIAIADVTPLMVSPFNPVQEPSCKYDVKGFRFSLIYGRCKDFAGLDVGLIQHTTGGFGGLAIGGVHYANDHIFGAQVCGLVSRTHGSMSGVQIGGLLSGSDIAMNGLQIGGLYNGPVTGHKNDINGVQIAGVINKASNVHGLQIGLFNFAETMECGLQIGLWNQIESNGWATVLPLVNGHF